MAELFTTSLYSDSNLRAYYRFLTGALTTDSKNSYTLTNNNTVGEAAGKYGIGADFGSSNTNKYLKITSALGIGTGDNKTFNTWIKPTSMTPGSGGQQDIFEHGVSGGAFTGCYLNSTGLLIYVDGGSPFTGSYTFDFADGNWHMVTLTYNASTRETKGYIDSVERISFTPSSINGFSENVLSIGFERAGGIFPYSGLQDDFSAFNRLLTQGEINTLFAEPPSTYRGFFALVEKA